MLLDSLTRLYKTFSKNPIFLYGEEISRKDTCSFCGNYCANLIGVINYWDLTENNVVQCKSCRHMQLDPMLSAEQMELGCKAYHEYENLNHDTTWLLKNSKRQFRAGIRFNNYLNKHKIQFKKVLELGPGNGFFSRALLEMHPDINISCVDIVPQVLKNIKSEHGFDTYCSFPENMSEVITEKFDLIIARDILEHVSDPGKTIQQCKNLLSDSGVLYVLSPNGYEDVWPIHVPWYLYKKKVDLLINHVNYFDGASLVQYMEKNGFKQLDCFQYKLKDFLRGKGWKYSDKYSKFSNSTYKVSDYIKQENHADFESVDTISSFINIKSDKERQKIALINRLNHIPNIFNISPKRKFGHYLSCLMQKV